jgi:hypothetical protein
MRIREVPAAHKVSDPLVTFSTSLISFLSIAIHYSKLALNVGNSLLRSGRFSVYIQHAAPVEDGSDTTKDASKVRGASGQRSSSLPIPSVNGITRNSIFEIVPKTSQEAIDMTAGSFNEPEDAMVLDEVMKEGTTCSSSAMDESMGSTQDSLSRDPTSRTPEAGVEEMQQCGSGSVKSAAEEVSDWCLMPTSEPPRSAEADPYTEVLPRVPGTENSHTVTDLRERSIGSDAYEPPEPDPALDNFNTANTPPFSPAPPCTVELANVNVHSIPLAQNVEALTLNAQDSMIPVASQTVKVSYTLLFDSHLSSAD